MEIIQKKLFFLGSRLDKSSGFVHLSTASQLKNTIKLYFAKNNQIVIVELITIFMKGKLKMEVSRNYKFFPHYYGVLNFKMIKSSITINLKKNLIFI